MSDHSPFLNSDMKRHPTGQVRVYSATGKLVAGTSCAGYLAELKASKMVTTVDGLDAIRTGVTVLAEQGSIWVVAGTSNGKNLWITVGDSKTHPSRDLSLPVRVLETGGDS